MNLSHDRIAKSSLVAHDLLKKLKIGRPGIDPTVVSVDELYSVISDQTKITITLEEAVFEATRVRGKVERWNGGKVAKIYIRQQQDLVWKRFVTAKELLHLVIDNDDDFNPYGDETLEYLVELGHFGWLNSGDPFAGFVQSEVVAEIAALEVLYPLRFRSADLKKLHDKDTTRAALGVIYEIPSQYVATALNDDYLGLQIKALEELRGR